MNKKIATDWTTYYKKKKSFFSTYTQKYTLRYIGNVIERMNGKQIEVLECGGGNSCFCEALASKYLNISKYDILDNNEYAVKLFNTKGLEISHEGTVIDLTQRVDEENIRKYDFVYSIGLIEHFSEEDRKSVIDAHFSFCKPGGIVFISFPTPTLKYRICRKFMELTGTWQFWDETPLTEDRVRTYMEKDAVIIDSFLNRELPLSQHIIVAKKCIDKDSNNLSMA